MPDTNTPRSGLSLSSRDRLPYADPIFMPTYVYETIPTRAGEAVRRFEFKQSMKDPALTHDPESGTPVRRVISGGFAPMTGSTESQAGCENGACPMPEPARHSCGTGCGCFAN